MTLFKPAALRNIELTYAWDFASVLSRGDLWLQGAEGTLEVSASSLALAIPLGFILSLMRTSSTRIASAAAVIYIDFFRSSSQFVLIFWFFYAFPILVHLNLGPFAAGTIAIGTHFAALFAEIFRAGITSVDQGHRDAAKAIGLNRYATLSRVVLPQAFRTIIPIFFAQIIELIKATAFASVISFNELSFTASRIASETYRPIETFLVVAAIYFIPIFIVSQIIRSYERYLTSRTHRGA